MVFKGLKGSEGLVTDCAHKVGPHFISIRHLSGSFPVRIDSLHITYVERETNNLSVVITAIHWQRGR